MSLLIPLRMDWYGPGAVYVELNRNFLQGDAKRNRELAGLARDTGVPIVASNDVHYHTPERSRLHDALVAVRLNTTIDQALPHLLPNHNFALKSQAGMQRLFAELPEALSNTLRSRRDNVPSISAPTSTTLCQTPTCRTGTRPRAISKGSATRPPFGGTEASPSGWKHDCARSST